MAELPVKILLVEDNPGDARLLEAMLSSTSDGRVYEVTHAKKLSDALDLLSQQPMDAVLLDLSLPDSRGVGTIDHAAASVSKYTTPIIVVTGRPAEGAELESVQHGADDYLLKSGLNPEILVRSIQLAIERQRTRLRNEAERSEARHAREIESLEQMGSGPPTSVTARAYGLERLSDASPDTFNLLVEQYCDLIDQALEQRKFRLEGKVSQALRVMAQRLGFLRASPRDVVELHTRAIKSLNPTKMTTSYVIAEEARLMLIELMGCLASYYRDHMMPFRRTEYGDRNAKDSERGTP